jgi:hypothetical protein
VPADDLDEIALSITGIASDYSLGVVPECEEALALARNRLRQLGVCEGRWHERSGGAAMKEHGGASHAAWGVGAGTA